MKQSHLLVHRSATYIELLTMYVELQQSAVFARGLSYYYFDGRSSSRVPAGLIEDENWYFLDDI